MADSYVVLKVPRAGLTIPTEILELIIKHGLSDLRIGKLSELQSTIEQKHNEQIDELKQQIKEMRDELNCLIVSKTDELQKQMLLTNKFIKQISNIDHTKLSTQTDESKDVSEYDDPKDKIDLDLENVDSCIKQIKKLYIDLTLRGRPNKLANLLSLLSIDQQTLDSFGGYDDLTSAAKLDYTSSIITDVVVKKILEYKETNKTNPTRKDIVQKKILTDSAIRRLFLVIKTKKQIDYIIKYCESFASTKPE